MSESEAAAPVGGTPIPLVDLAAQHAGLKPELDAAIAEVIAQSSFIQGPAVAAFEDAFAKALGVRHCIGVANGTAALMLALQASGIGPGDEVITASLTFFATAEAICTLGARPVFVDVDPVSATLDPVGVAEAVTARTRAIVPVHLYGGPCDMDPILAVARRHGLMVVEDAAQAHLASYRDGLVGTFGHAAGFSFFPGKNLGALGDAGAVTTNDDTLAARVRALRDHGRAGKYLHDILGFNYRMDGLQGAVLALKLRHLPAWTEARRGLAARYEARLGEMGLMDRGVTPIRPMGEGRGVFHLYVVRLPPQTDREAVQRALHAAGIATGVHYPVPCHQQPALVGLGCGDGAACSPSPGLPVTEDLVGCILSLPMYPELGVERVDRIVASLDAALTATAT